MKRLFFDMDNVLVDFQSGLDRIDEETKNNKNASQTIVTLESLSQQITELQKQIEELEKNKMS